jgi:hypothetical protein
VLASLLHNFENKFEPIDNRQLLNEALGATDESKLCQRQVYRSKEAAQVTVFRAWKMLTLTVNLVTGGLLRNPPVKLLNIVRIKKYVIGGLR